MLDSNDALLQDADVMFTGGFDATAIPPTDVVALGAEDVPGERRDCFLGVVSG